MNKNDALMTRARRLDPIPTDAFEDFADSAEAQEILERVLKAQPDRTKDLASHRRGLHLEATARRIVAVGVASVVLLGITTFAVRDVPDRTRNSQWAPGLVSIAQASPRYLIEAEGWTVASVHEVRSDYGEMFFQNGPDAMLAGAPAGQYWMSLNWYPSEIYDHYVADRRRGASASWKITIAGHDALLFKSGPTVPLGHTFYALWLDDGHSMELRTDVIPTADEFIELAAQLQPVDVDTWLSAMPESVVRPDERGDAVDRILAQLPLPAGLDIEALKQSDMVKEDYALDAEVRTYVVCAWIQQWINGRKSGNDDAVKEATTAMEWRGWSGAEGAGSSSYESRIAAAMKTNTPMFGDRSVPIGVTYQRAMECPQG